MNAPTVPISIPQVDELHNIHAGLESVVWLCYQAIKSTPDSDADDATKTAGSIHSLLSPWQSRLRDVLDELEEKLAEQRRELRERKAKQPEGPDYFSRSKEGGES